MFFTKRKGIEHQQDESPSQRNGMQPHRSSLFSNNDTAFLQRKNSIKENLIQIGNSLARHFNKPAKFCPKTLFQECWNLIDQIETRCLNLSELNELVSSPMYKTLQAATLSLNENTHHLEMSPTQ